MGAPANLDPCTCTLCCSPISVDHKRAEGKFNVTHEWQCKRLATHLVLWVHGCAAGIVTVYIQVSFVHTGMKLCAVHACYGECACCYLSASMCITVCTHLLIALCVCVCVYLCVCVCVCVCVHVCVCVCRYIHVCKCTAQQHNTHTNTHPPCCQASS